MTHTTELIRNAVEQAAARCGADAWEICISSSENTAAEALRDEVSSISYALTDQLSVRCVKNGRSGNAGSELVTAEAAAELAEMACANAEILDERDVVEVFGGSEAYAETEAARCELPSTDSMKEDVLRLQRMTYAASDKIVDGTQCQIKGMRTRTAILNSAGLDLSYECGIVCRTVAPAVKDGEMAEDDYRVADITRETEAETVEKAVQTALSKLGAESVESGKYDVIFDHGALRSLLSAYMPVFSARSAYLKTTLLAGKEGQTVAAPCVTVTDDPFYPGKFGRCPFDGEGVAARKKKIIENGVLNTLLYNRMYAKLLGRETTGNAAGAKHITAMGLYIEPGDYTTEQLLERLGSGIFITDVIGLHAGANVESGDFSLQAEGFLVENGKKGRPLKNFTVADNFFRLLKKVDAVSDAVEFGTVSSIGAPKLLVKDISISGK